MEQPTITYDERLKEYMKRKGYNHIYIQHVTSCGCCVDLPEIASSFVNDARAEEIRAHGCVVLPGEVGDILVARGMDYDSEIKLGLSNFLGIKDVTVKGIRAWSL